MRQTTLTAKQTIFILLIILLTSIANGHPGRIDQEGGHNVHEDWTSKGEVVFDKGTYHFHTLGKMRLGSVTLSSTGVNWTSLGGLSGV